MAFNNVFNENGVPFMGGTYFPKETKHELPSFKEVLQKFLMLIRCERIVDQKI